MTAVQARTTVTSDFKLAAPRGAAFFLILMRDSLRQPSKLNEAMIFNMLPMFLLVVLVATGCRATDSFGQAQKMVPVIGWQNQALDELGLPSRLPLHEAIEKGDTETVQTLIVDQAALDSKNQFGATPLHLATANGNLPMVQLLLHAGAKPDQINFAKQTPLHFAALNGNAQIAQVLIQAGAEVNSVDDEDWTPLDCALWQGKGIIYTKLKAKRKVAELLVEHGGKEGEKHDH